MNAYAKHLQKYKERVVLHGNNVKDEEGYRSSIRGAKCFSFSDDSCNVLRHYLKAPWYGWRSK